MILLFALILLGLVLTGFDALHDVDASRGQFERDFDTKTGGADGKDSSVR